VQPSLAGSHRYLDDADPYDMMHLGLFLHGAPSLHYSVEPSHSCLPRARDLQAGTEISQLGIRRTMSTRTRLAVAVTAVALLWAGFAYNLSRPADYQAYHRTMLQVAESAHDATQTGWLTAQQRLADRVTTAFARTAFDDAGQALAGAQKKFATRGPPDPRSVALRDRLAPLLSAAVTALGDTSQAQDDSTLRADAAQLHAVAQQLDDFITAHQ
jgi:hypothetical protein